MVSEVPKMIVLWNFATKSRLKASLVVWWNLLPYIFQGGMQPCRRGAPGQHRLWTLSLVHSWLSIRSSTLIFSPSCLVSWSYSVNNLLPDVLFVDNNNTILLDIGFSFWQLGHDNHDVYHSYFPCIYVFSSGMWFHENHILSKFLVSFATSQRCSSQQSSNNTL